MHATATVNILVYNLTLGKQTWRNALVGTYSYLPKLPSHIVCPEI